MLLFSGTNSDKCLGHRDDSSLSGMGMWGLAKKLTEKLASCEGMLSVQKVCSNKQCAITQYIKSVDFYLVLEFGTLLFYRAAIEFCLGVNISLLFFGERVC